MTTVGTLYNKILPELLKERSPEAFDALYDKYAGTFNSIICKIVQDTNNGEELLQDVFVKIWRNIDKYDSTKATLFTWMLNIARNTCIDYMRRSRNKTQLLSDGSSHSENLATALETDYNAENIELRGLVLKLQHKYRQIIDLVYFWGYTQEEVSQILSLPLGTVKTRSRTGLQQLRTLYQSTNKE